MSMVTKVSVRSTRRLAPLLAGLSLAAWACLGGVPCFAQAFTSARVVKAEGLVSLDHVTPGSPFKLAVVADVQEGWHVNAHQPTFDYLIATNVALPAGDAAAGISFGDPIYPAHKELAFSFTGGKTLRVYEGRVLIGVAASASRDLAPSAGAPRKIQATLTVQACNDNSCLAPAKIPVEFTLLVAGPGEAAQPVHPEIFGAIAFAAEAAPSAAPGPSPASGAAAVSGDAVGRMIAEHGWIASLGLIFVWGLALNLTPCVYPVIPITLAYFGGQAAGRPSRTFTLASIYVLGMCVTYSTLGVVAALTGSILGSALQSPISLVFVALVMVGLGLSMFGLYDIQVPAGLRRRISSRPGFGGALFMGLTVGLVAAPCVGPIVVSLLIYVGRAGSPLLGFTLFFVLALGLGLPYLFLGGFSGAATGLPRAGAWMDWVKKVFGCIMFAMAAYFLNPLLPEAAAGLTIPIVLLASGLYLGFVEASPIRSAGFRVARFTTAAACAAIAAALLIPSAASAEIAWEAFSDEALAQAVSTGRPAIIDFTADWCLPCKELDRFTFSDARVLEASSRFSTLKADITSQMSEPVRALQQRFEILGAPTIVFIDSTGRERRDLRLTGFEKADRFLERMNQVH
jgi:thioredoxin:protein disulfide reductase